MDYNYRCKICDCTNYEPVLNNIRDWEYGFDGQFSYYRCRECFTIQLNPFPNLDDLKLAYKVDYHGYNKPENKGFLYSFLYRIVEIIGNPFFRKHLNKNSNVLDVGCGIGLFLMKLKKMDYNNLTGIDFSESAIKTLKENGIKYYLGTFLDYNCNKEQFDLIIMNNYLEHTLNPLEELYKTNKILKKNGILMGELPNFNSCDRMIFNKYWGGNHVPRHTFQFNHNNLKNILNKVGYKNIKIEYPLNTSHFALSIQNFMQRNVNDLKNNKSLIHGRSKFYSLFLICLIPINIICKMIRKTGFIKFIAYK